MREGGLIGLPCPVSHAGHGDLNKSKDRLDCINEGKGFKADDFVLETCAKLIYKSWRLFAQDDGRR